MFAKPLCLKIHQHHVFLSPFGTKRLKSTYVIKTNTPTLALLSPFNFLKKRSYLFHVPMLCLLRPFHINLFMLEIST